jgi:hypothetical protein
MPDGNRFGSGWMNPLPAIVNVDVLITGVLHAVGRHRVRGFADELFVDVAGEFIPTVPTHRRGQRQLIEFLRRHTHASDTEEDRQDSFHGRR